MKFHIFTLISLLSLAIGQPSFAVDRLSATQKAAIDKALDKVTLNNSPPTTTGADYKADKRVPQIPSFAYTPGTPAAEAMPASIVSMMGAGKYSPNSATAAAGKDPLELQLGKLSQLPFISKIPLANVVAANPAIAAKAIKAVFPTWGGDDKKTMAEAAADPEGMLPIPPGILASTDTANFPGILDTPYENYEGIGKGMAIPGISAKDLPGIADLSFKKLIKVGTIPAGLQVMKADVVHSGEKRLSVEDGIKVASGSNKEPHAPCKSGNCGGLEMLSAVGHNNPLNPLNGVYGLSGMRLKGGEGILGDLMTAAGFREPSGFRVPYIGINGCGSTISFESPNAKTGSVTPQLNLRFCYSVFLLGFQASPHFIPIPLPLPVSEKQANLLIPMEVPVPVIARVPGLPTVPNIPVTPTAPNAPVTPTAPNAPGLPTAPNAPVTPTVPNIPVTPTAPNAPVTPTAPNIASVVGTHTLIPTWSPTLGDIG
jgi:hypothetical protein